ncbi:PT domain-containing protein [Streptomyces sp. NPDC087866]|uniref:PT domain-containing protein n=1 Tax=Streptomyces sp. NPDC087866 TaxID=3365815 RepID=UPI00382457A8
MRGGAASPRSRPRRPGPRFHRPTDRPTDGPAGRPTGRPTDRPTDRSAATRPGRAARGGARLRRYRRLRHRCRRRPGQLRHGPPLCP